jgi:DNA (cytosine-5)-methyltransferase 1
VVYPESEQVGVPRRSRFAGGSTSLMADARYEPAGRAARPGEAQRGRPFSDTPRRSICCPWDAADWLPCRDGKARPVESGTFPLAHGIPARVGRLRGYGNAIVPQVAAAFIRAAA